MEFVFSDDFLIAAVFVLTYLFISIQRIPFLHLDRPGVALAGAVLMVLVTPLTLDDAYQMIEWNTITLLLGMMIMVGALRDGGFFRRISYRVLIHSGTTRQLLWLVIFLSGLLSALFVNDTICLLMTPVILTLADDADLNPVPLLIALATSANIGSVMTLVGNPQNMLVGSFSGISFLSFFCILAPVAVIALLVNGWLIRLIYRREFPDRRLTGFQHFQKPRVDWFQVRWTVVVFLLVLVLFLTGVPLALGALIGAVAVLIIARKSPQHFFVHVDWSLLLMFASLFVVVGALRSTHWMDFLKDFVHSATDGNLMSWISFSLLTLAGSNLVSNVPFVILMKPVVESLPDAHTFWLLLAMVSTFAGNLTLLGSVANLIVAESSKKRVNLSFIEFLKVGVPVTFLSVLIGLLWIWIVS
ncbi:MAG: anion transporter [Bacteroidetes bacterium]|nr:anion transporter [Bacteroidota bacterium]